MSLDVSLFTSASLTHIAVPPTAGRLFGGQDTPQGCRVAIVNEAARDVLGGPAVGQALDDSTGQKVEIVGVVAPRRTQGATEPRRPTIYYYANQASAPAARSGTAAFRVPVQADAPTAALDVNIVSAGYFEAMGWALKEGRAFADDLPGGCRVAVVNEEAAQLHFAGKAVGAAVIDEVGRRAEIVGVVHAAPLGILQRPVEPSIYFPMAQDFLLSMTLILGAREAGEPILADLRRQLEAVPGRGAGPVIVRTLDSQLSRTALAPLRIATTLVGALTAMALGLGIVGLYGAMTDSTRLRRSEIAVRLALGAPAWRVVHQVVSEGLRWAAAGTVAGMVGSILVARSLARITPHDAPVAGWVWVATPLVLIGAVAIAGLLPAYRALTVDPVVTMRADR